MVRAIPDGRKTQTRRLKALDFANECPDAWRYDGENVHGDHLFYNVHAAIVGHEPPDCNRVIKCPYGKPGDRLWVREAFAGDDCMGALYRADFTKEEAAKLKTGELDDGEWCYRTWTPSIHMPRSVSRITLEVTNVRVERLQDISDVDAKREGVEAQQINDPANPVWTWSYRVPYADLWDVINGKKYPWSNNPWVWVIEFKKL